MNTTRLVKTLAVAVVILALWFVPVPAGLEAETWHLVALYLGLLLGLVLKPFPEPIITLIVIGLAAMFIDPAILLAGYGDDMVWFIALVTIVCTAFVKTGLGKRIAYNLLLRAGKTSLGLGYVLVATDLILSPATGSNSARQSIIFPIFRAISEGIGSTPEKEPRKLGAYLTVLSYASSQGTSALFLTGMATNAIAVSLISEMLGLDISWGMWILASVVPVGLYLLLAPFVLYKIYPPELKSLEDIKPLVRDGLAELGPMSTDEKKMLVLFILAVLGWMFGPNIPFVDLSMQIVGFVFLALVLLTGILDWNDVIGAKSGWSLLVWYGAFYGVASSLADQGFYTWLAEILGEVLNLGAMNGLVVAGLLLVASLLVRYFFVSSSAFVASFYPVLLTLAASTSAPPFVVAMSLCLFAGFGALLTHYGNGAGLIAFASGYVPQKDFWLCGTLLVLMELVIVCVIGVPYWHILGLW